MLISIAKRRAINFPVFIITVICMFFSLDEGAMTTMSSAGAGNRLNSRDEAYRLSNIYKLSTISGKNLLEH